MNNYFARLENEVREIEIQRSEADGFENAVCRVIQEKKDELATYRPMSPADDYARRTLARLEGSAVIWRCQARFSLLMAMQIIDEIDSL